MTRHGSAPMADRRSPQLLRVFFPVRVLADAWGTTEDEWNEWADRERWRYFTDPAQPELGRCYGHSDLPKYVRLMLASLETPVEPTALDVARAERHQEPGWPEIVAGILGVTDEAIARRGSQETSARGLRDLFDEGIPVRFARNLAHGAVVPIGDGSNYLPSRIVAARLGLTEAELDERADRERWWYYTDPTQPGLGRCYNEGEFDDPVWDAASKGYGLEGRAVLDPERTCRRRTLDWAPFDRASDSERREARARLSIILTFGAWLLEADELGRRDRNVYEAFVAEHPGALYGASARTLRRWVDAFVREGVPGLVPVRSGRCGRRAVAIPDEAHTFLRAAWLNPLRPNLALAVRLTRTAAAERGWRLPSDRTLTRALAAIPESDARHQRDVAEADVPAARAACEATDIGRLALAAVERAMGGAAKAPPNAPAAAPSPVAPVAPVAREAGAPSAAPLTLSAEAVAAALGCVVRVVQSRAQREGWPFVERPVRGGRKRFYPLDGLPAAVRQALGPVLPEGRG